MNAITSNLSCRRCGWSWYPRTPVMPKVCPKCKSYDWQEKKPRKERGA